MMRKNAKGQLIEREGGMKSRELLLGGPALHST